MIRITAMLVALLISGDAFAQPLGRATCASATCHGGAVDRGPAWNHSLTKWVSQDPHAGSGLLLRDDDSRAIVIALNSAAASSAQVFDQVLRRRCIGCHTSATPQQCESDAPLDDSLLAEGVSCESCHGDAKQWLELHVRSDWSENQRVDSQAGMRDTESIVGRSVTCLQCHVGSRFTHGSSRDMNHDVIAAGHPVLRFDLLTYTENLPKHWSRDSKSEKRFDESAIRVRRTSRAIMLAAAAHLSAKRAEHSQSDKTVPWPELSDYDCFACHQSLSMAEYRLPADQKKNGSPLRISDGLLIWNSWHSIGQKELSKRNLAALAPNRIAQSPRMMKTAAKSVARQYEREARLLTQAKIDPFAELKQLRSTVESSPPRDWHAAAIQYLDADAILRDLGKPLLPLRQRVEPLLRFDGDKEKPEYASPVRFNAVEFQRAILDVVVGSDGDVAVTAAGETNE